MSEMAKKMITTTPTPEIPKAEPTNEIIWPQGEFWSDEPPWESYLHLQQIILLIKTLEWFWQEREDYFAAGNLTIYYSRKQKKSKDFPGPDFFVVTGTTRNEERRSWVVWEEGGKYPNVIIEILSDSTAEMDREEKKAIYQDIFRTPDYFWFDPFTLEFQGFSLISGEYQPIQPTEPGWLWSQQLELYLGIYEKQLRYFTPDGVLVPTPKEAAIRAQAEAENARQRAEAAINRRRAETERQRAETALERVRQLEERLRNLGIEPND